ncbi:protein cueball isoform X2 [Anabrus simplex]|uniref:protein cueball isoform X2 n=1 Tax=Anabrus simplex TaxID=316456 RepID=UPI0035A3D174
MCWLIFLLQLLILPFYARSWDLAIAVNNNIELLSVSRGSQKGVSKIRTIHLPDEMDIRALAFDPVRNRIFVSTVQPNAYSSIYEVDLNDNDKITELVKEDDMMHRVLGIAYDHVSDTLYWTNGGGKSILLLHLNVSDRNREQLHPVNKSTSGIALDVCSRTLFWTTKDGTIERSSLDGTNRKVIISGLSNPTDITVDQKSQRLFWCDDRPGIHFSIESSNLDGLERQTLMKYTNHQPVSIATTTDAIYWTNNKDAYLWRLPTGPDEDHELRLAYEFSSGSTLGLISRDNSIRSDECLKDMDITPKSATEKDKIGLESNPTIQSDQSVLGSDTNASPGYCANGGTLAEVKHHSKEYLFCMCPGGFSGFRCEQESHKCEQSLCKNYCYNGNCSLDELGFPHCKCPIGYHGNRCEHHVCEDVCLNGGKFRETAIPGEGNSTSLLLCSCTIGGAHIDGSREETECYHSRYFLQSLVIALGAVGFVLLLVCVYLMKKVYTLRKRPRIKKRIIVNKNVTPLTSRPPPTSDQCEITIENCCNMNICETPCYEPHLRSDSKAVSKTEEKRNLLGNMEGESSCAPCQDSLY